jgi:hypothetical protein
LKWAKIEAIAMRMRWSWRRRSVPDAAAAIAPSLVAQMRAFYAQHRAEVIERMRHPTAATENPAATIVLISEDDTSLRGEAYAAQEAASAARVGSSTLDVALRVYELGGS